MAVTVTQTPFTYNPASNDQFFSASSNQTAQPNFNFYITATVFFNNGAAWTSQNYIERYANGPDGFVRFNARHLTESYIKHLFEYVGISNWRELVNSLIKVTINIGEEYGATPVIYPGVNTTIYNWNASLTFLTMQSGGFIQNNYVCQNGSTFPLLNDLPDLKTTSLSVNLINLLSFTDNVITKATITSTDGVSTATFDIANPFFASGNWYDAYIRLNVGPAYLAAIGGVNWIGIPGTTYTVDFYDNPVTVRRKRITLSYTDVCSRYDKYQMIYLNSKGAFDWFIFEMISTSDTRITRTNVRHQPYSDPTLAGIWSYDSLGRTDFTLSTSYQDSIKLNSDWMTAAQLLKLKDLVTSPVVYLQDLTTGLVYAVNNKDTVYIKKRKFNDKLLNLEINVAFANLEFRQRGI